MFHIAKGLKQVISLAVLIAFSTTQVAWAAPANHGLAPESPKPLVSPSMKRLIQDPYHLDIPFEYVALKEIHPGQNGKLIIHIQDAHANFSGQKSLASALDYYIERYGVSTVLVEGGDRDVTLDELKKLTDSKTWDMIANKLLHQGIITGPEFLNLTSDSPMRLMGIEYTDLYEANLEAYAELVDRRKQILLYLHRIQLSLDRVKNRIYPRELLAFEQSQRHGGHEEHFSTSIDALLTLSDKAGIDLANDFPEVSKLATIKKNEASIDFKKATAEQSAPQYKAYLKSIAELEFDVLLDQLEALEDRIYKELLTDKDTKKIRAIDRFLGLLKKAYHIQMSAKEFEMFEANDPYFGTAAWQEFMNQKLGQLEYDADKVAYKPYLEEAKQSLQNFYSLVEERDAAFLENTNRILKEKDQNIAFLIAGGYHTENLTDLLRQAGYSYVVLAPLVTHETDHEKYEEILLKPLKLARRNTERELKIQTALEQPKFNESVPAVAQQARASGFNKYKGDVVLQGARSIFEAHQIQMQDVIRSIAASRSKNPANLRTNISGARGAFRYYEITDSNDLGVVLSEFRDSLSRSASAWREHYKDSPLGVYNLTFTPKKDSSSFELLQDVSTLIGEDYAQHHYSVDLSLQLSKEGVFTIERRYAKQTADIHSSFGKTTLAIDQSNTLELEHEHEATNITTHTNKIPVRRKRRNKRQQYEYRQHRQTNNAEDNFLVSEPFAEYPIKGIGFYEVSEWRSATRDMFIVVTPDTLQQLIANEPRILDSPIQILDAVPSIEGARSVSRTSSTGETLGSRLMAPSILEVEPASFVPWTALGEIQRSESHKSPLEVPVRVLLAKHWKPELASPNDEQYEGRRKFWRRYIAQMDQELAQEGVGENRPLVLHLEASAPVGFGLPVLDPINFLSRFTNADRSLDQIMNIFYGRVPVPPDSPTPWHPYMRFFRNQYEEVALPQDRSESADKRLVNMPGYEPLAEWVAAQRQNRLVVVIWEEAPFEAWVHTMRRQLHSMDASSIALVNQSPDGVERAVYEAFYGVVSEASAGSIRDKRTAEVIALTPPVLSDAVHLVTRGALHRYVEPHLTEMGVNANSVHMDNDSDYSASSLYIVKHLPDQSRFAPDYQMTEEETLVSQISIIDTFVEMHIDSKGEVLDENQVQAVYTQLRDLSAEQARDWFDNVRMSVPAELIDADFYAASELLAQKTYEWALQLSGAQSGSRIDSALGVQLRPNVLLANSNTFFLDYLDIQANRQLQSGVGELTEAQIPELYAQWQRREGRIPAHIGRTFPEAQLTVALRRSVGRYLALTQNTENEDLRRINEWIRTNYDILFEQAHLIYREGQIIVDHDLARELNQSDLDSLRFVLQHEIFQRSFDDLEPSELQAVVDWVQQFIATDDGAVFMGMLLQSYGPMFMMRGFDRNVPEIATQVVLPSEVPDDGFWNLSADGTISYSIAGHDALVASVTSRGRRLLDDLDFIQSRYEAARQEVNQVMQDIAEHFGARSTSVGARLEAMEELIAQAQEIPLAQLRREREAFVALLQNTFQTHYDLLDMMTISNIPELQRQFASYREAAKRYIGYFFGFLKIKSGVTLAALGSFTRGGFTRGSDQDWMFIIDEAEQSQRMAEYLTLVLQEAGIPLDERVLPRRHKQSGNYWVKLSQVQDMYETQIPTKGELAARQIGVLDSEIIAGDVYLWRSFRQVAREGLSRNLDLLKQAVKDRLSDVDGNAFSKETFNLKWTRGMIFTINAIFWLLALETKTMPAAWYSRDFRTSLRLYQRNELLTASEIDTLFGALHYFLFLRNHTASYNLSQAPSESELIASDAFYEFVPAVAESMHQNDLVPSAQHVTEVAERHSLAVREIYADVLNRIAGSRARSGQDKAEVRKLSGQIKYHRTIGGSPNGREKDVHLVVVRSGEDSNATRKRNKTEWETILKKFTDVYKDNKDNFSWHFTLRVDFMTGVDDVAGRLNSCESCDLLLVSEQDFTSEDIGPLLEGVLDTNPRIRVIHKKPKALSSKQIRDFLMQKISRRQSRVAVFEVDPNLTQQERFDLALDRVRAALAEEDDRQRIIEALSEARRIYLTEPARAMTLLRSATSLIGRVRMLFNRRTRKVLPARSPGQVSDIESQLNEALSAIRHIRSVIQSDGARAGRDEELSIVSPESRSEEMLGARTFVEHVKRRLQAYDNSSMYPGGVFERIANEWLEEKHGLYAENLSYGYSRQQGYQVGAGYSEVSYLLPYAAEGILIIKKHDGRFEWILDDLDDVTRIIDNLIVVSKPLDQIYKETAENAKRVVRQILEQDINELLISGASTLIMYRIVTTALEELMEEFPQYRKPVTIHTLSTHDNSRLFGPEEDEWRDVQFSHLQRRPLIYVDTHWYSGNKREFMQKVKGRYKLGIRKYAVLYAGWPDSIKRTDIIGEKDYLNEWFGSLEYRISETIREEETLSDLNVTEENAADFERVLSDRDRAHLHGIVRALQEGSRAGQENKLSIVSPGSRSWKRDATEKLVDIWTAMSFQAKEKQGFFPRYPPVVEDFVMGTILSRFDAAESFRHIDLGPSSNLYLARRMQVRFPQSEVHALDVFDRSRTNLQPSESIIYHQGFIEETGQPDGHYDTVVSSFTFNYLHPDDYGNAIMEISRILDDEGIGILVFHSPDERVHLLAADIKHTEPMVKNLGILLQLIERREFRRIRELANSERGANAFGGLLDLVQEAGNIEFNSESEQSVRKKINHILGQLVGNIEVDRRHIESFRHFGSLEQVVAFIEANGLEVVKQENLGTERVVVGFGVAFRKRTQNQTSFGGEAGARAGQENKLSIVSPGSPSLATREEDGQTNLDDTNNLTAAVRFPVHIHIAQRVGLAQLDWEEVLALPAHVGARIVPEVELPKVLSTPPIKHISPDLLARKLAPLFASVALNPVSREIELLVTPNAQGDMSDNELRVAASRVSEQMARLTQEKVVLTVVLLSSIEELNKRVRPESTDGVLRSQYVVGDSRDVEALNAGQMAMAAYLKRGFIAQEQGPIDLPLLSLVAFVLDASENVARAGQENLLLRQAYGEPLPGRVAEEIKLFNGLIKLIGGHLARLAIGINLGQQVMSKLMTEISA